MVSCLKATTCQDSRQLELGFENPVAILSAQKRAGGQCLLVARNQLPRHPPNSIGHNLNSSLGPCPSLTDFSIALTCCLTRSTSRFMPFIALICISASTTVAPPFNRRQPM